jgi:hypothetical protein
MLANKPKTRSGPPFQLLGLLLAIPSGMIQWPVNLRFIVLFAVSNQVASTIP